MRPVNQARVLGCLMATALAACSEPRVADPTPARPLETPTSTVGVFLTELAKTADPARTATLEDLYAEQLASRLEHGTVEDRAATERTLAIQRLLAGQTERAIDLLNELRASLPTGAEPGRQRQLSELLALAYLRLGEQQNCVAEHSATSCILPIDASGRHRLEDGSRQALRELSALLAERPDLGHVWLLNLAAMTLGEHPQGVALAHRIAPEVFASEDSMPPFDDLAGRLGLAVTALSGGVAMEDFDRDGRLDLITSSWGLRDPLRYFANNGDGSFTDRSLDSGLEGQLGGLNLVHADYDNDGYADLFVLRGAWLGEHGRHPNTLLHNRGDGSFEDVTESAGLLDYLPSQTAAWADYDGDGHLDLFVGNESRGALEAPCRLFRGNGDGTFSDVAPAVGLDIVGFVKGATWGDYDNDGRPDLYLSRLDEPNLLFHNDGPGSDGGWAFTESAAKAGVAAPLKSFPTWFWDFDNDGWLDLLVAGYSGFSGASVAQVAADYLGLPVEAPRSRLYRNRGDGSFEDITRRAGFDDVLLAMGANFGDIDNDGWLDAYIGTGEPSFATLVPNRMYRNDSGRRLNDVTTAGRFGHLQKGHAIAFGDIDNDGDQDLYSVLGGAYSGDVYPNALLVNPGNGNGWLTLILEGTTSNRGAIGARVRVVIADDAGERTLHRVVGTGGSFGSSSLQLEIGLGTATAIRRVEVDWPAPGPTETFSALAPNATFRLREGAGTAQRLSQPVIDLARRGWNGDGAAR